MMAPMSDRGLPIVDGAPACPFVAFDDDRDARASGPDHRHRCYAEVRPAPRALAHQEAYCLSSAFPVCPTFQDWARREAARATAAAAESIPPPVVPGADPGPGTTDRSPAQLVDPDLPRRNPPREWSAPPPWLGADHDAEDDDDERDIGPLPPQRGGGLVGSFADRLASGRPTTPPPVAAGPIPPTVSSEAARSVAESPSEPAWRSSPPGTVMEPVPLHLTSPDDDDGSEGQPPSRATARRGGSTPRQRDRERSVDGAGPVWERPRRREAYPTIRTRMGLGGVTVPSILIGVAAVLIAAVALFFLPALLGIGNPPASGAPTGSAGASTAASASASAASPTSLPEATQQVYVVQAGDTMSRIATRFGIPLQVLIDANKTTIPNPDRVNIGDRVTIPASTPTTLPGASPSP